MSLALQHPANKLLIKPEVTKYPILSHSKIPSSSLNAAVAFCVCFFPGHSPPLPPPPPPLHPIIIAHSHFFAAAAGWKTAFSWGPVMQSTVSVDSRHLLSKTGVGRRRLKGCPSFARLICPSLGGRDILGFAASFFWQSVSSSWLVCSCLLQGSGVFFFCRKLLPTWVF